MDLAHQATDVPAVVVPRHTGVQVLPQPLDRVRVRAIRRREVQLDPAAEARQGHRHDLAVVDAEVIEDHMDRRRAAVRLPQLLQLRDEQGADLTLDLHP